MDGIVVARIVRAHGLQGGLLLHLETNSPEEVFRPGVSLRLLEGHPGLPPRELPARLTVTEAAAHGKSWILHAEEIEDRSFAERFAGAWLALPAEELPELREGEYFLHDLLGLEVVDEELGRVGEVEEVYDVPGGPLLAVWVDGRERLLPFRREMVSEVDLDERRVRTRLPAGLLEV